MTPRVAVWVFALAAVVATEPELHTNWWEASPPLRDSEHGRTVAVIILSVAAVGMCILGLCLLIGDRDERKKAPPPARPAADREGAGVAMISKRVP